MKQSQRIVKNVLAGGIAVGIGGVLQLLAVVLIARSVSVGEFGTYSFILAFAMFVGLLADSGLSNILVRELSTQPERKAEIFGAALSLIWLLSIAGEILILGIIPFLHFSLETKLLIALMGVATLTQFHCSGYTAALQAHEDNELQSLGFLLHKVAFLGCIYAAIVAGWGLLGIVLGHVIPNLILWTYFRRVVVHRYGRPKLHWNPSLWKHILTHSLPVGGAGIMRVLAQQVDILVLTWLTNVITVGLFSGPYRISMAFLFIPQTMSVPLYPMYSRLAKEPERRPDLEDAYQRSIKFFLLAALPVAVLFLMSSERVITTILGPTYAGAVPAMQWLAVGFVPFFLASPFPFLLAALHEQRFLLVSAAISLAMRIGLNFALVPYLGSVGTCLAFIASETLTVALWMGKLSRLGFRSHFAAVFWRPLLAGGVMGAMLYFAKSHSLILFGLMALLSVLVYVTAVLKLRVLSPKDIELTREGLGFLKPFLAKRGIPSPKIVS